MARVHPKESPAGLLWRGVSDLAGPIGDALYGVYDRSDNVQVRDAGSVEKRRGYERAVDELFHGPVSMAVGRSSSSLVFLAVDDEGVKVLSSLPQSEFTGFTVDHPGFMADEFARSNAADIQSGTTLPWVEGVDSEENTAHTAEDTLEIVSNQLRLQYADGASGYADWGIEAPTPWHTQRVELDLSAVNLSSGQNCGIYYFMGLPDFYTDGGTVVKNRIWSVDGVETHRAGPSGSDHAWAGYGVKFAINAKATGDEVRAELFEFGSSENMESRADRTGRKVWSNELVSAIQTTGNVRLSWVLEIGRRLAADGGWITRLDCYRDKTIAQLETGTIENRFFAIETSTTPGETRKVNGDAGNGYLWNLPLSGKGGYSGLRCFTAGTPSGGSVRVERVTAALDSFYITYPE